MPGRSKGGGAGPQPEDLSPRGPASTSSVDVTRMAKEAGSGRRGTPTDGQKKIRKENTHGSLGRFFLNFILCVFEDERGPLPQEQHESERPHYLML